MRKHPKHDELMINMLLLIAITIAIAITITSRKDKALTCSKNSTDHVAS